MCMKGASANYTPPAPAPTVQTDAMSKTTGDEMAEQRRKFKKGFESTILGPTAQSGQKSILGG